MESNLRNKEFDQVHDALCCETRCSPVRNDSSSAQVMRRIMLRAFSDGEGGEALLGKGMKCLHDCILKGINIKLI